MKRSIEFDVTIGSKWVRGKQMPLGGFRTTVIVSFETDGEAPYDDAVYALGDQLGRSDFHIWYWTWLD